MWRVKVAKAEAHHESPTDDVQDCKAHMCNVLYFALDSFLAVDGFFPGPPISLWLPCELLSFAELLTVTVTERISANVTALFQTSVQKHMAATIRPWPHSFICLSSTSSKGPYHRRVQTM